MWIPMYQANTAGMPMRTGTQTCFDSYRTCFVSQLNKHRWQQTAYILLCGYTGVLQTKFSCQTWGLRAFGRDQFGLASCCPCTRTLEPHRTSTAAGILLGTVLQISCGRIVDHWPCNVYPMAGRHWLAPVSTKAAGFLGRRPVRSRRHDKMCLPSEFSCIAHTGWPASRISLNGSVQKPST
jgi:hypothetical protein